jgi:outer membrane protein assembly factor BamB
MEEQPGASFPAAGSPTVTDVDGARVVLFGAGEHLYALDAATGAERWRFAAGTGCRDATTGQSPGLCSFTGERNQVESTPIVADGTAYFGMDINDVPTGKGGFYAVDVATGRLAWFFDVESGAVCRPASDDDVRRYDGYHSEAELGLPAGFLATRDGCDHPRNRNGCGNVWSSPAFDPARSLLVFGTSNCDTDADPGTPVPDAPMPPYDEAVVALSTDGLPQWRWRPREVDNDDLAFGGAPNLFSLVIGDEVRDVVGIGSKDGTYYVLDREGRNVRTGVRWSDPGAATSLPYWQTKVVPGGAIGGVIQTAAIDQRARKVLFSTGPGEDVLAPQRPTVHALDLDTGAVLWQNRETDVLGGDASYGPTSAVPGVAIVGSVITPHLRLFDTRTGRLLLDRNIGSPPTFSGISSGATVLDGTLVVGTGIGSRTQTGSSPGDFAAYTPAAVVALCVPGSRGCR